ncbi:Ger(x)C family spore germination protein [Paenibacillus sp. MMS18-CY102]|uniref:Ger(x)C family spore germination protein n=1 Tax=Paenibacillus sp. MMS18-CY102 TaxID=2682849 RepID=UPI0013659BFA|nr:Ger(x)C family spore germination protein [Paenibacillus sp. MMS18-CY102]MWC27687.1 Ger(x)C family spore germination protein [Paenibacillus sp. MMS18-CY102]
MRIVRLMGLHLLLLAAMLQQGCGNSKDIQALAYVTALGIDYVDGNYITYAQVLNFSNIARTESNQLGKKVPIWIGSGRGKSMSSAIAGVTATSQFPMFWGHLKAVVMTESVLQQGLKEIYLTLNRYREVRYNIFVYGTKENPSDILNQTSLFNLSPLDTIMFTGTQLGSQKSYLLPVNGNHAIANLNEPGNPAIMPSISTTKHYWKEDQKSKSMFEISGAFFFENNHSSGWMSIEDLKGIRWANRRLEQAPLSIPLNDADDAVVMLAHPHLAIKPVIGKAGAQFDLHLKVSGTVYESHNKSIETLELKSKQLIEKEIRETYHKGLAKRVDPFQLEEALYRKNPAMFYKLAKTSPFFLDGQSLRHVKVQVKILSTGKYKEKIR